MRVAYQGEPGAFGDAAIIAHWNGAAESFGAPSFTRALAMLVEGRADAAVLPVWNLVIGDIAPALSALRACGNALVETGSVTIAVRHALLALPGATLDSVRAVGSHAAALGQCARFLRAHPAFVPYEATDTAGAARQLASLVGAAPRGIAAPWYAQVDGVAPESLAAIASEHAAARYGLTVLARDIQDHPDNATRFAVLERR